MLIPNGYPSAVACICGDAKHPQLQGRVEFYPVRSGVLVAVDVKGFSQDGFYALHIHEGESCAGTGFPGTGGHYNPRNVNHPDHAGDLPALLICGGKGYLSFLTNRFCLREVIGRTVVIHSNPDDFVTQPAGNAGTKIACGLIRPC